MFHRHPVPNAFRVCLLLAIPVAATVPRANAGVQCVESSTRARSAETMSTRAKRLATRAHPTSVRGTLPHGARWGDNPSVLPAAHPETQSSVPWFDPLLLCGGKAEFLSSSCAQSPLASTTHPSVYALCLIIVCSCPGLLFITMLFR